MSDLDRSSLYILESENRGLLSDFGLSAGTCEKLMDGLQ